MNQIEALFDSERRKLAALIGVSEFIPQTWQEVLLIRHRNKIIDIQETSNLKKISLEDDGVMLHVNDIRFTVFSDDTFYIAWEVFHKQIYSSDYIKNSIVCDVGANIGLSALWFLSNHCKYVECFEPNPKNISYLEKNLLLNPQFKDKYLIHRKALWDTSELKNAVFFDSHPGCGYIIDSSIARVKPSEASDPDVVSVQTMSASKAVENLLNRTTDNNSLLMKLDCEGSELKILKELSDKKLLSFFSNILCESHDDNHREITSLLDRANFIISYKTNPQDGLCVLDAHNPSPSTHRPLVSVIVPAYNAALTIRETVDSILNQTYKNIELIVVDDGSTDETVEILSSILDRRLRIISIYNSGQSAARNKGIAISTGNYIAFCDADDVWLPRKILRQLQTLALNPDCDVTHSWTSSIDRSGAGIRLGATVSVKGNVFSEIYEANFFECGSTALVTRKALSKVGEFVSIVDCSEDWDMWLRLASEFQVVTTPFVDVLYRQSPSSLSTNIVKIEKSCKLVLERYKSFVSKKIGITSAKNIVAYISFKVIHSNTSAFLSIKYLLKILFNNPCFFFLTPQAWRVFIRILTQALFPRSIVDTLCRKYPSLMSADSIMSLVESYLGRDKK